MANWSFKQEKMLIINNKKNNSSHSKVLFYFILFLLGKGRHGPWPWNLNKIFDQLKLVNNRYVTITKSPPKPTSPTFRFYPRGSWASQRYQSTRMLCACSTAPNIITPPLPTGPPATSFATNTNSARPRHLKDIFSVTSILYDHLLSAPRATLSRSCTIHAPQDPTSHHLGTFSK